MKNLALIKLLATDEQVENKINSNRKHLILQDNKLFNPFKNEYYELSVLSGLDDKIENLDWVYNKKINKILQIPDKPDNTFIENIDIRDCQKVIATTDKNLNTDNRIYISGLIPQLILTPKISLQFIELFITEYNKGHIITEVEVEYESKFTGKEYIDEQDAYGYDIFSNSLLINKDNTINISLLVKDDIKEFVNTNYSFFTKDTRNKMILGINAYIKTMK